MSRVGINGDLPAQQCILSRGPQQNGQRGDQFHSDTAGKRQICSLGLFMGGERRPDRGVRPLFYEMLRECAHALCI